MNMNGFISHDLGGGAALWAGRLPDELIPDSSGFEALWQSHPADYHQVMMHGRLVNTPRWQQAYGMDYHYTGNLNRALPMTAPLKVFLNWGCEKIDERLNGLLINWYDGSRGHYIGKHRDDFKMLIPGAPIVTISLGEERIFRLRPWPQQAQAKPIDFPAHNGRVFVMPWETNLNHTHEITKSARNKGRRVSITLRGFLIS